MLLNILLLSLLLILSKRETKTIRNNYKFANIYKKYCGLTNKTKMMKDIIESKKLNIENNNLNKYKINEI